MSGRLVNELNDIDRRPGVKIKRRKWFGLEFALVNVAVLCRFSAVVGKRVDPAFKGSKVEFRGSHDPQKRALRFHEVIFSERGHTRLDVRDGQTAELQHGMVRRGGSFICGRLRLPVSGTRLLTRGVFAFRGFLRAAAVVASLLLFLFC